MIKQIYSEMMERIYSIKPKPLTIKEVVETLNSSNLTREEAVTLDGRKLIVVYYKCIGGDLKIFSNEKGEVTEIETLKMPFSNFYDTTISLPINLESIKIFIETLEDYNTNKKKQLMKLELKISGIIPRMEEFLKENGFEELKIQKNFLDGKRFEFVHSNEMFYFTLDIKEIEKILNTNKKGFLKFLNQHKSLMLSRDEMLHGINVKKIVIKI